MIYYDHAVLMAQGHDSWTRQQEDRLRGALARRPKPPVYEGAFVDVQKDAALSAETQSSSAVPPDAPQDMSPRPRRRAVFGFWSRQRPAHP